MVQMLEALLIFYTILDRDRLFHVERRLLNGEVKQEHCSRLETFMADRAANVLFLCACLCV